MDNILLENLFISRLHVVKWGSDLEKLADQQSQNTQRNNLIISDVEDIFKNIYEGHFETVMYGSRVTKLATNDSSDIDLLIDTNKSECMKIDCPVTENWILNEALKYIREKCSHKWTNAYAIFTCRTPVLKIIHGQSNMQCDITVRGKLGVSNTKMMKLYIQNTPFFRQMILIAREWSIFCHLTKELHNYTVSLLVLFYLQVEGFAVSVKDLKFESEHTEVDVTGYEFVDFDSINYKNLSVKQISDTDLYNLLIGFFAYYSTFDYENDIVCPLLGHPVKKKLFCNKNLKKLPAEMHSYVKNIKTGDSIFKTELPICVQDPLDLSHNLIKVTKKNFDQHFQELCLHTSNILKSLN